MLNEYQARVQAKEEDYENSLLIEAELLNQNKLEDKANNIQLQAAIKKQ